MYQQIKYIDDSYLTKDHRFLIIARKRWIILVYDDIKNNYSDLKCALYADSLQDTEILMKVISCHH